MLTGIPTSARVRYGALYPGIDAVIYGSESGGWEYDFIVAPGTDPATVALAITGATGVTRDAATGGLVLGTAAGDVQMHAPTLYQEVNGARRPCPGGYAFRDDGTVGFTVGDYDRALPLTIDPEVQAYGTYVGGSGTDSAAGIAVNSNNEAYITGQTDGNFPTTNGNGFMPQYTGGTAAFVTKLNATGSARVFSTYLGASGADAGAAVAVDAGGNAYVTGFTIGAFPTTPGAFHTTIGAGGLDVFVTKLTSTGMLAYSTYLGISGSGGGLGQGIAVDAGGNAYVTGVADTGLPLMNQARGFTSTNLGNAFLTKLNAAGSGLLYSTYLGGTGYDQGFGVAVGSRGNAFLTGQATTADFPIYRNGTATTTTCASAGAMNCVFQAAYGGNNDAFVARIDTTQWAYLR